MNMDEVGKAHRAHEVACRNLANLDKNLDAYSGSELARFQHVTVTISIAAMFDFDVEIEQNEFLDLTRQARMQQQQKKSNSVESVRRLVRASEAP